MKRRYIDYTPKFTNATVRKRCLKALGFCCSSLSYDRPRAWARVELDRWFGTQNHNLSRWLRDQLLIEHSGRWNKDTGECKQWLLRESGVRYLCEIYNHNLMTKIPIVALRQKKTEIALEWAEQQYGDEIRSGQFQYKNKSLRLWNDLQRMPTEIRRPLFHRHGYEYEYDIQACAPTLITQYARRQGMTAPTPELDLFLADRQLYRQVLAELLGCTARQSKEILNAIFAGARLGPGNSIARILNDRRDQLQILSDNVWFRSLRKDIKKCWDAIKKSEGSQRLSSRDKWMIYFGLEKSVMSVVRRELRREKNRHFLEHDGWRCESYIDPESLRRSVRRHTGFDVQFDYVRITYTI